MWRAKALERYPPATVRGYASHRALLADDNARHAALALPRPAGASCDYKYNRVDRYFECIVTGVEWDRGRDVLRVAFDARGEPDLRHPLQSSLGVVVHRALPDRARLRAAIAAVAAQRRELREAAERLAPAAARGDLRASQRRADALNAHNIASYRVVGLARELQGAGEPLFCDMVTVLRPGAHTLVEAVPGHFRGWMDFEGVAEAVDTLPGQLPDAYRLKREVATHGLDVLFSYANPVAVLPQAGMVDYHPAPLLHVPPGEGMVAAARGAGGRYVPVGALGAAVTGEAPGEGAARWTHVRAEMEAISGARRFQTWFV